MESAGIVIPVAEEKTRHADHKKVYIMSDE